MPDWDLLGNAIKLKSLLFGVQVSYSLGPTHLFLSLFPVAEQKPFDLFSPGFLLTVRVICLRSHLPVLVCDSLFLLLIEIGATRHSVAVLGQAFDLCYPFALFNLPTRPGEKVVTNSTLVLQTRRQVLEDSVERGFGPSRLPLRSRTLLFSSPGAPPLYRPVLFLSPTVLPLSGSALPPETW